MSVSRAKVNAAATPQPAPVGDGAVILDLVVEDLKARSEMGERKYGTKLRAHNGRDALMDLYQEILDAAAYAKQLLVERDTRRDTADDWLEHRVSMEDVRRAVNSVCYCGGSGPDDNPCLACSVWHILHDAVMAERRGQ